MIFFIINSILSLVGLWISYKIFRKKRDPKGFICEIGGDCKDILTSKFSKFFGIDIEIIGFVYYLLTLIGYLILSIFGANLSLDIYLFTFVLSFIGFAFSLYLLAVQAMYIRDWCAWCVSSAFVSTIIFFVSAVLIRLTEIQFDRTIIQFIETVMRMQFVGVLLGVAGATVAVVLTIKFLKDFKIDAEEDKKLTVVNQIVWVAILLLLIVHVFLYLINPEIYLGSDNLIAQLIILLVIILNNSILNLGIGPKLIGTRMDLNSIHVFRTFCLRQVAFAMGTISILSWYVLLLFSFFETNMINDVIIMISYYLSIIIAGLIVSQLSIMLIDKVKAGKRMTQ